MTQLIRVGDRVRLRSDQNAPIGHRRLHTVVGIGVGNAAGTLQVDDVGYPVKADLVERVTELRAGGEVVLRNGRGLFEYGGRTYDTLVDAVAGVRAAQRERAS